MSRRGEDLLAALRGVQRACGEHQREQERADRVVKITNKVHDMIVEALPTSYPEFEQVMHYVDWTLLNQPGGLMDIDHHLIEKVMEEFVVRKVAMTREHN